MSEHRIPALTGAVQGELKSARDRPCKGADGLHPDRPAGQTRMFNKDCLRIVGLFEVKRSSPLKFEEQPLSLLSQQAQSHAPRFLVLRV